MRASETVWDMHSLYTSIQQLRTHVHSTDRTTTGASALWVANSQADSYDLLCFSVFFEGMDHILGMTTDKISFFINFAAVINFERSHGLTH